MAEVLHPSQKGLQIRWVSYRHPRTYPASEISAPKCPLGKQCKISVVSYQTMLVECVVEKSEPCPKGFYFDDGVFCRALMKTDRG